MNIFLTNKNYRRFSIASFLSSAGDILFYLAFMTYASKLKNYSLALSLIAISESLPKLFTIFGGYFADKTQHKFKNIFLSAIIRCVLYGIVGLLFISNVNQWSLVIIVVTINLISDTFGAYSSGLVSPLVVDLVGKDHFGEALSLIAISESLPKLFTIFGGYFADKTQHKFKNIFLSAIIRCVLYGIVGLLFISNVNQWSLVIIVVTINLISDTFGAYSSGLVSPLVVDLVGKDHFGEAEGFTNGVNEVINIAAQFIGSALLLIMSYSSLAFLNAVSFLLAGILFASVGLRQKSIASLKSHEINTQSFLVTMKASFKQVKKQTGLLEVVLIVAVLNGSLSSMGSLIPIMIAAHKTAMVISRYSFTIALMGVVVACGAALGSMFGTQLFKKFTIFSMTILATLIALMTTFAIFATSIYLVLGLYFLLALTASATSIKLTQWLVTSVEHKILASTVGLLNTILIASAPLMTTILTTVSGATNIRYALILLVALEVITFLVELKVSHKVKVASIISSVKE